MAIKSIFETDEFKGLEKSFQARKTRYRKMWGYFKANYSRVGEFATPMGSMAGLFIANQVKTLFQPMARAVHIDTALIPGRWKLDPGAEQYADAWQTLQRDSKWPVCGDHMVRYAAAMGESGLMIVDNRNAGEVTLQPIRPETYVTRQVGPYDSRIAQLVTVSYRGDDELATVYEPARIRTFENGQPKGVGGRPASYENKLGFVPFVSCLFDTGDGQGEPTFDDTIVMLDAVNEQASYLAEIIKKHAEPQWAAFGADAGELTKSGDSVWFFPEGSDLKAILATVDIVGVLEFIKEIKTEMKESLPELAFSRLVGIERIAAATIELQLAEPVMKIRRLRKPVDLAVADAIRLAGLAAANMARLKTGIPEDKKAGLDQVATLANLPEPGFDAERPVIDIDALTLAELETATTSAKVGRMAADREEMLANSRMGAEL